MEEAHVGKAVVCVLAPRDSCILLNLFPSRLSGENPSDSAIRQLPCELDLDEKNMDNYCC